MHEADGGRVRIARIDRGRVQSSQDICYQPFQVFIIESNDDSSPIPSRIPATAKEEILVLKRATRKNAKLSTERREARSAAD